MDLYPQEIEILRLISLGIPFKAIPKMMNITLGVARNYSYRARVKLGAKSNAHAVRLAMEKGLLGIEISIPANEEVDA